MYLALAKLHNVVVLAVEEGGEAATEAPNPILPETNELIWGALAFTVLFVLLARFAYPMVREGMENRTERIRQSLDEAEEARNQAQQVLEEYQRQLAEAREEAARIIEEARQTADSLRRDLQQQAEAEIAEMRQRAANDVEAAKARAIADLQSQVADLAIGAAEVVVQANLDRDAQIRLIENYINEVAQTS